VTKNQDFCNSPEQDYKDTLNPDIVQCNCGVFVSRTNRDHLPPSKEDEAPLSSSVVCEQPPLFSL